MKKYIAYNPETKQIVFEADTVEEIFRLAESNPYLKLIIYEIERIGGHKDLS